MKLLPLLLSSALITAAHAQESNLTIQRDVAYVESGDPLQKLDVYTPPGAKNFPVVI